jgi:hypothetical protein
VFAWAALACRACTDGVPGTGTVSQGESAP